MVQEIRGNRGNGVVTAAREETTGITDTVTIEIGIMVIIMTEAGVTGVEDVAGAEAGSEVGEVTGVAESSSREAGPSPILPKAGTSSQRRRTTEAGVEVARESTISTRGLCSNTGQVRDRVMRRTRWSMVGRQDLGQDPGQDHDL